MQAAYVKVLWSLQQDARYIQAFQQESDNARAHLTALLSASPSTMQKLFVLLSQASSMHGIPGIACCVYGPLMTAQPQGCCGTVIVVKASFGKQLSRKMHDLCSPPPYIAGRMSQHHTCRLQSHRHTCWLLRWHPAHAMRS